MRFAIYVITSCLTFTFLSSNHESLADDSAWELVKMESFKVFPTEIDLSGANTDLKFELTVSHPLGVKNTQTKVFLSDNKQQKLEIILDKSEKTENVIKNQYKYSGSVSLPRFIPTGPYYFYAEPITALPPAGRTNGPTGNEFYPNPIRNLIGAESAVLVRLNGELNYAVSTFVGPNFPSRNIILDDKNMTLVSASPIWRAGEEFDPSNHFEKRVSGLQLQVSSLTPEICTPENKKLILKSSGGCIFTVFTEKTKDFLRNDITLTVQIKEPRVKPSINVETIKNQINFTAPKIISKSSVYSSAGLIVVGNSLTPNVCISFEKYIQLNSRGTCQISYQTQASESFLASDVYVQSFEIEGNSQTITFTPPATANISAKTLALSATASGGGVITYQTTSTGICSITGSTLNLLKGGNCSITATQAGTTTLAPISATATVMIAGSVAPTKKTITCVKGNKTKKVSGTNPKCPKGYKVKR